MSQQPQSRFLRRTRENADLNQYWYSAFTIEKFVEEIVAMCASDNKRVAFVSTPSLFFSIPQELQDHAVLFDLDEQWKRLPNFVRYDFNEPTNFGDAYHHSFDMVVIDPPFVTEDAWSKFATTAHLLMKDDGLLLCTTLQENRDMMAKLFGVDMKPRAFKPSIPHLVYQYATYCNYEPKVLNQVNPEIPDDE